MKQIKQMVNPFHPFNRWIRPAMLALLSAACRAGGGPTQDAPGSGRFDLTWNDSTGPVHFAVPAAGSFCARDSLVEILGSRNDSAIGIVLLTGDSTLSGLGPGTLSVMPAKVFIPWRPRAIAALRMTGVSAIEQFESSTGQVELTAAADSSLSGRVDLHMVASSGPDTLRITGEFQGIRITRAPFPCGRADKPGSQ
jgi:hypothetical protein